MSRPAAFMQPTTTAVTLRPARADDLAALNGVIERAVMTWQLAERVKRLSLPSYRYHAHDLDPLHLVVAEDAAQGLVGVAAWEPAGPRDGVAGRSGLLLHGLYVDPSRLREGIGSRLLAAAADAARAHGLDGVLVRAQVDAVPFFEACGLLRLPVEDPMRDYPHRCWLATRPTAAND